MIIFVFAWIALLSLVAYSCDGMQLRKHDQRITEPTQEESILAAADLNTETATEHNTNTTKGCGQGTMTCLNFASDNTDLPVRCGTLTNVPLCPNNEPQEACDIFCDSDGGARLCSLAFETCCSHSKNGCISSHPIHVRLYK